jgi:hypothetical protein
VQPGFYSGALGGYRPVPYEGVHSGSAAPNIATKSLRILRASPTR